jgi:hypothetical protein
MFTHRRFATAVSACALLAVTGCGSADTSDQDNDEPPVTTVPTLLATVNLRLPVQDYLRSDTQAVQLTRGRVSLIRQCMMRFGMDYTIEEAPAGKYGPRSLTDRRYGITDLALARQNGYGLGDRDPALQEKPAKPDIGPEGEAALFGDGPSLVGDLEVPSGGCIGEADRALNRSMPAGADPMLGQKLQFESFELSKEDSRVRAAFSKWSSCMEEAGYHYPNPLAAAADPRFTEQPPTEDQVAAAITDIECKGRTNLVGVWFSVEAAYQTRQIEAGGDAFTNCRKAIAAQQDMAAKALQEN